MGDCFFIAISIFDQNILLLCKNLTSSNMDWLVMLIIAKNDSWCMIHDKAGLWEHKCNFSKRGAETNCYKFGEFQCSYSYQSFLLFFMLSSPRKAKASFTFPPKKWIFGPKMTFLAKYWHFWPIWSHGRPKNANKGPMCFFCYVGTKTFASSCKIRIFGPKRPNLVQNMHFVIFVKYWQFWPISSHA